MNRSKYNNKGEGGIKKSEKKGGLLYGWFRMTENKKNVFEYIYIKVSDNYH